MKKPKRLRTADMAQIAIRLPPSEYEKIVTAVAAESSSITAFLRAAARDRIAKLLEKKNTIES